MARWGESLGKVNCFVGRINGHIFLDYLTSGTMPAGKITSMCQAQRNLHNLNFPETSVLDSQQNPD